MALPEMDAHGNLPPGRHEASVDEVRAALVDPFAGSHTRRAIFDWWTELRDALCELGAFRYPDGDAGQVPAHAMAALWSHHFGTDRDGNERGLVVVPA